MAVRIPKIVSVELAVKIYYENLDLGNAEIRALFGKIGSERVCSLKKIVVERMKELGQLQYNPTTVRTKTAYEVWGLDIDDLEKRLAKLKKLCG